MSNAPQFMQAPGASPAKPSGKPNVILEALRSGDPQREKKAIEALYPLLNGVAGKMLGTKAQRAGLQPESVVLSVWKDHATWVKHAERSDDDELRARLILAVKHKAIDVLRREKVRDKNAVRIDQLDCGIADTQATGPNTIVARHEEENLEREASVRLDQFIDQMLSDHEDRFICRHYLIDEEPAQGVGGTRKLSAETVRTRASRMRKPIASALVKGVPLEADEWALAKLHFVEGIGVEKGAAPLGLSAAAARELMQHVLSKVRDQFGMRGIKLLTACRKVRQKL